MPSLIAEANRVKRFRGEVRERERHGSAKRQFTDHESHLSHGCARFTGKNYFPSIRLPTV